MKNILFVNHATDWGGATSCLVNLINKLDATKYDVEVLLLKKSIISEKFKENNIKYRIANSSFYTKYYKVFAHSEAGYIKWYQVYSFLKLSVFWILSHSLFAKKELNNYEYDIIHLNSSVLTDWLKAARKKSKVVIHIREPFRKGKFDILHYYFRYLINRYASHIIAISVDNAKRINIPNKTDVIYDYCNFDNSEPSLNSYASKKVLYLGGTSKSKGFYTLVNALDYLNEDIIVYFCGKYVITAPPSNLINLIKYYLSNAHKRNKAINKIKLNSNFKILGMIYNVQEYLDEVCCLVSPFLVPHFSCPVIEAHLKRKPAIGTDVEGMEEIILNHKNGLIVPNNNPKALATAINELAINSKKAEKYGLAGYIRAKELYTPDNINKIESIYEKL